MGGTAFRCVRFATSAVSLAALLSVSVHARTINDHRNPSRGGGAYTLNVEPVFEMKLTLQPGQRMICETRNPTPRADPVLHVLRGDNPQGVVSEIARDDDSAGNLNARVTFQSSPGGKYLLVLRAAGPGAGGKVDLFCDGRQVWPGVGVGGSFKRLEQLRANETLTTVTLPGGPRLHTLYALEPEGRMRRRDGNGASESATFTASATNVMVAMVGQPWPDPAGNVRLVRNDNRLSGHDSDGDGLGNELERAIGTCSSRNEVVGNWDCARSADARDTDGDGLADALEVLGDIAATPYQWLPRWGANPLHKDLFLEVDYGAAAPGDPPQRLTPEKARAFAAIYADQETSPLLRLRSAQALNNPNLQPGIMLHFDSGVSPPTGASPQELALYGDWGGHDVAAPVKVNGEWRRADAANVWKTMMTPRRRGMFHYVLAYPDGGGQAPIFAFAVNLPLNAVGVAAHELGHTLGLDHSGPSGVGPGANCKPNYPSLESYAYLDHPKFVNSFSDGYGRSALNNVNLPETHAVASPSSPQGARYLKHLNEVFGYSVDPVTGSVDWNRDGVFSATPVRAYANNNRTGCEFTRVNQIRSSGLSDGAVSLARLNTRTYLGYVDERDRRIHVSWTDHPMDCLVIGEACGSLSDHLLPGSWNRSIFSLDMLPVNSPGGRKLLIVFRSADGLFEVLMDPDGATSGLRAIARGPQPDTELSLAGTIAPVWLGLRDAAGNAAIRVRDAGGNWSAETPVIAANGAAIGPLAPLTSPGLLHAIWPGGVLKLMGAFPLAPDGSIALYMLDETSGRWEQLPWANPAEGTVGRPALAFEPVAAGAPIPGRLRLLYLRASADGVLRRIVKLRTLDAGGIDQMAAPKMVAEDHDNVWYYGNGVDLLFEPGRDSNLRAAVATALIEEGVPRKHFVELRPLADGIVNFVQRNWDDWEALGLGICKARKDGGANVNCHPWPFTPPPETTGTPAPLTPAYTGTPEPGTPQTPAQCRAACTAEFQQCMGQHGNPNICRQTLRLCRQECN